MISTNLEQIDVRVNHGVAEVRLHVGHRLPFYLQAISDPHVAVDLRQAGLQANVSIRAILKYHHLLREA